jgi:GNAT superfamily N-acetyltransferase
MTSTRPETRMALISDAAGIARLMSNLGYPCTSDQMQARLKVLAKDEAHITYVATINGNLAGIIGAFIGRIYEQDDLIGRVIALIVSKEYRGIGLGKLLIQTAEHWINSCGANTVLVNSGFDREDAHKFYESVGYSAKGVSFRKRLQNQSWREAQ